jgi:hypothetical protein|tara:strand:+ start:260 stop:379 length:120 start_codon:yes stop_codon:yes gene_type:complete
MAGRDADADDPMSVPSCEPSEEEGRDCWVGKVCCEYCCE